MIIDFHTHIFPDKIAQMAIETLSGNSGLKSETNGTQSDTLIKMSDWGVDKFVVLNIATNPKQQQKVNDFAISNNCDNVICFGSVHPDALDALDELVRIKESGLKGIKLHPEYQHFDVDDRRVFPIYERCRDLGLIITFHAGKDIAFPDSLRAHPKAIRAVSNNFKDLKMIAAHMGGFLMWDEVEEYLVGSNVYIDTSFSVGYISKEQATRIIKKHGADKVLFGSDCPWESSKDTIGFIESMGFTDKEKELIYSENAIGLLF